MQIITNSLTNTSKISLYQYSYENSKHFVAKIMQMNLHLNQIFINRRKWTKFLNLLNKTEF